MAITADQTKFTDRQLDALSARGIATDAPEPWLTLFFHTVVTTGLDPFREQIRLLLRREPVIDEHGELSMDQRWSIEVSIQGCRILGRRAADEAGIRIKQPGALWYDDRAGVWGDAWPHPTPPPAAKYTLTAVYPDGERESVVGQTHFVEYVKSTLDGTPTRGWAKMPAHMLAKCAEALAWTRLFPGTFSGVVLTDSVDINHTPASPRHSPSDTAAENTVRPAVAVLGPPRTAPSSPPPPPVTAATDDPGTAATAPTPSAPTPSSDGIPAVKRARGQARASSTAPKQSRQNAIETLHAALGPDTAAVHRWASDHLGRTITNLDDVSNDELQTLRSTLPETKPTSDPT
ncbi:hypothetical protein [Nocardia farcinica]|uniref:hypothetical protein n=1 Tax=Nocardia farcinica TaxID=37329 RepID=UPI000E1B67AD|nr:hypothetical protein [Nocardia farcinica]MBF6250179.1 hypothetical protein [Nocardia farcinica]MBF6445521.1 hypothetical protein [Nocardia farcinica]MBF6523313.1 hypothetical protein [Nocardia farcinica]